MQYPFRAFLEGRPSAAGADARPALDVAPVAEHQLNHLGRAIPSPVVAVGEVRMFGPVRITSELADGQRRGAFTTAPGQLTVAGAIDRRPARARTTAAAHARATLPGQPQALRGARREAGH